MVGLLSLGELVVVKLCWSCVEERELIQSSFFDLGLYTRRACILEAVGKIRLR